MKRLARNFNYVPPKVGHEGLTVLIKQAYNLYQAEVLTNKKSYRLCMFDFINSNQFHDNSDAWSKNEHQRNYLAIAKLLMEHEKLVSIYFTKSSLSDSEIEEMINRYYVADSASNSYNNPPNSSGDTNLQVSEELLSYRDELITELIIVVANEINLFKEHLNEADAQTLLGHEKIRSLTATNNSRLVLFFDKLCSMNLINAAWQVDIARRRLVTSSSGKKYLTQHDLSSSLYRLKERKPLKQEIDLLNLIELRYLQLKEKKSIKGNI